MEAVLTGVRCVWPEPLEQIWRTPTYPPLEGVGQHSGASVPRINEKRRQTQPRAALLQQHSESIFVYTDVPTPGSKHTLVCTGVPVLEIHTSDLEGCLAS